MKFKKITAVLSSVLIAGLSIGAASAASYPAPFVEDGVANVAIVYGTGPGVSSLDQVQAGNIQTSLASFVKGKTVVEGGEVFTVEKSSDMFNFGDLMNSSYTNLDDDEMPVTLVSGDYDDGDADTEYDQKITLKGEKLTLFKDTDYNDDEPTIGFEFTKNDPILDYEIDFDDAQLYSTIEGTDMPLMGKEFYVLEADTSDEIITLLDSASTTVMSEGESITVNGKTISVIIGDDSTGGWAKFTVDGETVDKMYDGGSEELSDETWIAVKEVLYQSKETAESSVEFTLGEGKLVLESGQEVEMNEEDIDGLTVTLTRTGTGSTLALDKVTLAWTADEDYWLAEGDSLTMPGFESIQLLFNGMDFPSSEKISFDSGDELVLDMEDFDLPTLRTNGTHIVGLGETNNPLIVDTTPTSITLEEEDRIVFTILPTSNDLTDAETRYYEVNIIENDSGDIKVEFDDLIGTDDLTLDDMDATDDGDFTFDLLTIVDDTNITIKVDSTVGTVYTNKVVTNKGLVIDLPYEGGSTSPEINFSTLPTTYDFILTEADKDDNINSGDKFTASIAVDTGEDKLHATDTNLTELETLTDDVYIGYVESELATMVEIDKSSDLNELDLMYYGKEVTGEVQIASADAKISGANALGDILVKDSEINSVDSKNLIIVGGSCINSAAATVLGGSYCGNSFTQATGISAGEFLIKGVEDAYTDGKLALVVAGYEAADTSNAVTYLTMKDVDTMKSYKGTSSTEATMIADSM